MVGPSANGLVGGQLVGIPQQTVQHRQTRVAEVKLRLARAFALEDELGIHLIEKLVGIHLRVQAGVNGLHIQVIDAGAHA